MLVSDILSMAKIRLGNIKMSRDDDAMISFIYLAVSELYRRFNLSIKAETIVVDKNKALYELRNRDVTILLNLYHEDGREMTQTDVSGAQYFDYKVVNYRSFLLRQPFDGVLYALYKASPIILKDVNDEIDLPDAAIPALLDYVSYMCHSTVNRDSVNETDFWRKRFETTCMELENQGFKIPLNTESLSLHLKGFV